MTLAGCGGDGSKSAPAPTAAAPPPSFLTHGGFNGPSNKLEITFKLALYERAGDPRGCYPAPARLVSLIRRWEHLRAGIASTDSAVHRSGVVYVLRRETSCNRLRMAILAPAGLYVLDSNLGPVQTPGFKRNLAGGIVHLGAAVVVTRTYRMTQPDETRRLTVACPAGTNSLGGGMTVSPPPAADGEGVYPHSYERLGVQRGWHISATLIDPTPQRTTPRSVTLEAECAGGFTTATPSPHRTVFIRPGQTGTVTARCPAGQYLFSGGFQRTDFRGFGRPGGGGDFVTESRAVSPTAWRVSGAAFGAYGGELTAIAYCVAHPGPLLEAVSASVAVPHRGTAVATTSRCPAGRQLTAGGFSFHGSRGAFFAGGAIHRNHTWSVTAFGYEGSVPRATAYAYCIRP